jgi:hypothetical protein
VNDRVVFMGVIETPCKHHSQAQFS